VKRKSETRNIFSPLLLFAISAPVLSLWLNLSSSVSAFLFRTTRSRGQLKPHPLLAEVRAHRQLLERLTTALALPDEDQEVGLRPGARHARAAARGRWRERAAEPNGKLAELRAAEWGRDGEAS
jgi:hypothetical protein